ncbi:MAG: hypothetical protein HND52_18115 [Ignavibacteriae bacterium]|nr:hypothetical protein [Ignavibacteriota bacterium]NOG99878.1 hypothetical protein [Ignavibacteriota bacterium]
MECEYKILLEKITDLLESRISLQQGGDAQTVGICEVCKCETPNIDYLLAGLKDKVIELWQAYKNYPIKVDYADRYVRAAYMLSYFPYYIHPIYHVLNVNRNSILDKIEELNVGFLGGGALPELVGLTKYVSIQKKNIININVTVFDSTTHWNTERSSVTEPLIKNYYPGNFKIESTIVNLWDKKISVSSTIKRLDVLVLQNTINEATDEGKEILKMNLIKIWNELAQGAIFIIIDLNYAEISSFINDLSQSIINKEILQELRKDSVTNALPRCYFIQDKLFDPSREEDGLYPRGGARSYWSIILKKG